VEELTVESAERDGWTVLSLKGDLDVYTAPRLKEAIAESVDRGGKLVAVDLSEVRFLDSTGLAVIVGGMKRVKENDGSLVLVAPNDQIRRILTITDLIKILQVRDSIESVVSG